MANAQINRMRTTTNTPPVTTNSTKVLTSPSANTFSTQPKAVTSSNSFVSMKLKLPFSNAERDYLVQKIGHFYVLNGDIIVGDDFPKTKSLAIIGSDNRWTNASIPVVIDQSIYDKGLDNVVYSAINEFNNKTEICIVPRTTENDYVKIVYDPTIAPAAGMSKVGHQGGQQQLSLTSSANAVTVMHEMLHAAGFYHEQGRDDRDNFINIKTENILSGQENQFQKEASGFIIGQYDYCSIMEYPPNAFSKNMLATIECIQNGKTVPCPACMGNATSFSDGDIKGVYSAYNPLSRFPCQTVFPRANYQPPHFAITAPAVSDAAMQAFRFRAQEATKQGFVGAYPNFYEARSGKDIVGGTIFLRSTVAIWQDVPLSELGNPPLNDFFARMRATAAYATRNGFVGGFPNFFHADYGKGTVCGTILISNAGAEWRDVPISELGNPPLDDIGARMRSANDYAVKHGYLSGFPNFFHADYGKGIVCGIILIKKEAGEWRDVTIVEGPR